MAEKTSRSGRIVKPSRKVRESEEYGWNVYSQSRPTLQVPKPAKRKRSSIGPSGSSSSLLDTPSSLTPVDLADAFPSTSYASSSTASSSRLVQAQNAPPSKGRSRPPKVPVNFKPVASPNRAGRAPPPLSSSRTPKLLKPTIRSYFNFHSGSGEKEVVFDPGDFESDGDQPDERSWTASRTVSSSTSGTSGPSYIVTLNIRQLGLSSASTSPKKVGLRPPISPLSAVHHSNPSPQELLARIQGPASSRKSKGKQRVVSPELEMILVRSSDEEKEVDNGSRRRGKESSGEEGTDGEFVADEEADEPESESESESESDKNDDLSEDASPSESDDAEDEYGKRPARDRKRRKTSDRSKYSSSGSPKRRRRPPAAIKVKKTVRFRSKRKVVGSDEEEEEDLSPRGGRQTSYQPDFYGHMMDEMGEPSFLDDHMNLYPEEDNPPPFSGGLNLGQFDNPPMDFNEHPPLFGYETVFDPPDEQDVPPPRLVVEGNNDDDGDRPPVPDVDYLEQLEQLKHLMEDGTVSLPTADVEPVEVAGPSNEVPRGSPMDGRKEKEDDPQPGGEPMLYGGYDALDLLRLVAYGEGLQA